MPLAQSHLDSTQSNTTIVSLERTQVRETQLDEAPTESVGLDHLSTEQRQERAIQDRHSRSSP